MRRRRNDSANRVWPLSATEPCSRTKRRGLPLTGLELAQAQVSGELAPVAALRSGVRWIGSQLPDAESLRSCWINVVLGSIADHQRLGGGNSKRLQACEQ